MNNKKTIAKNPLTSQSKITSSALKVKGHTAPKGKDVEVTGHLSDTSKHKDMPSFPVNKSKAQIK